MDLKITPIALIGRSADDYPAAQLLNGERNIPFTPQFVAGCLISLYEAFLNHVPENIQVEFEEEFKKSFDTAMLNRHEYMTVIKTKNND